MSRLKERYLKEIKAALQEKYKYPNPMLIPVLKKVVISMGLAEAAKDKSTLQDALNELAVISGQKAQLMRAKKSIAGFKLRKEASVGAKVTLRGKRMYEFVDRFCNISSPRIRDFRGFPVKCDGQGCYSLGLDTQQIFPEINLDLVKRTQGMNITFVTTCATDAECVELLKQLGLPFKQA